MTTTPLFDREIDPSKEELTGYPPLQKMPYNHKGNTVKQALEAFLLHSNSPYIVTGYTSLKQLVHFFSKLPDKTTVRLLLGNEPSLSSANAYKVTRQPYPEEVEAYWLSEGLSLRQSLELVKTLAKFEQGDIDAQYLDVPGRMLHAKIYLGEDNAVIGSSNFSINGLQLNIEGNVGFKKDEVGSRYNEISQFAELLWDHKQAQNYTQTLHELLKKLLRTVTWKESLARACSELLEGHWAEQYIASTLPIEQTRIWPAQRKGVAQALCILDQLGSVLLADATGSGKTRLGSVLLRAIHDRIWRKGRARSSAYTTLICPPGVQPNWQDETSRQGLQIHPYSQSRLSSSKDKGVNILLDRSLKQAQILCVDEAHNYLNEVSNRTKLLLRNMADHVVLQTATPINKGPSDLLSLINILGADNFDPEAIQAFNRYLRRKNKDTDLKRKNLDMLKKEISRFTVRRTKTDFNNLIDQAPHEYTDEYGRPCRYPRHDAHSYPTGESEQAIVLAKEIRDLAGKLKGVAFIKKQIRVPRNVDSKYSTKDILDWRLAMARAAAIYQIMSHLRSSKFAALAHIRGTEESLGDHKGMLRQLENTAGTPPGCALELDQASLPAWITEPEAHKEAAQNDHLIYSNICDLLDEMDFSREVGKTNKLIELVQKDGHSIVLAFDRHPLTLIELKSRIKKLAPNIEVLVGTGKLGNKIQFEERLKPKAGAKKEPPLIVLCSDAMSEGLNFQRASAVVNLDMPSVIRLLEQRVGRIDRMNSTHEKIDVYWPQDSQAFALRSDDKLIERHGTVESLLGSNVPLPEIFSEARSKLTNYRNIVDEHAKHADDWDGLEDAFTPIRSLIGRKGLIDSELYQQVSKHETDIQVQLTVVNDPKSWAFFCIRGSRFSAPKWVLIEEGKPNFITDLESISKTLLERLKGIPDKSEPIDEETQRTLDQYLDRIESMERVLIPKRKQVALMEMEIVLKEYAKDELLSDGDQSFLMQLLRCLSSNYKHSKSLDWASIADNWLELVRPHWYAELESGKTKRAILLQDIRASLITNKIAMDKLRDAFEEMPPAKPIEKRIVACIVTKTIL